MYLRRGLRAATDVGEQAGHGAAHSREHYPARDRHRTPLPSSCSVPRVRGAVRARRAFESADEYKANFRLVPNDPSVDVDAHAAFYVSLIEPDFGIELQLLGPLEQILKRVVGVVTAAEDGCF